MEKFIETFMAEYIKNSKEMCAVLSQHTTAISQLGECITMLKERIEVLEAKNTAQIIPINQRSRHDD